MGAIVPRVGGPQFLATFVRLFALAGLLIGSTMALAADRVALVIGNDDYSASNLSSLTQAGNDSASVAEALSQLGFDVTLVNNVDRVNMVKAIARFEEKLAASIGEVALIYYAGHGAAHSAEPWLLPVDARIEDPVDFEANAIPLSRLRQSLERARWKAGVIVLDACRNELFAGGQEPYRLTRASFTRGLGRVDPSSGILIAYATAAGEVAREQANATNSVYTSVLLEKLRQPGLDLYQIFNGTALEVARIFGSQQKPELMMTALETVYLINPDAKVLPDASPKPITIAGTGDVAGRDNWRWVWIICGLLGSAGAAGVLWLRARPNAAVTTSSNVTRELQVPLSPPIAAVQLRNGTTGQILRRLVPGDRIVVGRELPSDVIIPRAELSKRHAEFSFDGRAVWVKDLDSTNGVWLGPNARIPPNQRMVMSIGTTVFLADQLSPIVVQNGE